MKIAILADIHGNADALRAVLADTAAGGIERFLVAGDLVGYYYDCDQVLTLLSNLDCVCCRGNHEDIYETWQKADSLLREHLRSRYGSGYAMADARLSPAQKQVLRDLPHPVGATLGGVRFLVSHGAPWDINERLYPDARDEALKKLDVHADSFDIVVTAHTHYPAHWRRGGLEIINPGSVGQPRKRGIYPSARAEWASYDTIRRQFEHRTTYYDASHLIAETARIDPQTPYMRDVMTRSFQD
jgi:predicted phosphodiesterase